MLIAKRKQLTKSIVFEILIALILTAANLYIGIKSSVRFDERKIYKSLLVEYPDLSYDRKLTRIAESYAEICYVNDTETAQSMKILENQEFVKLYSTDAVVAKYAWKPDADESYTDVFFEAMQNQYPETNDCLKKCQYIGIGEYKNCIFLLACYVGTDGT